MKTHEMWKAVQRHLGITVDGLPGPGTASAVMRALKVEQNAPGTAWPRETSADLIDFYGPPGTGQVVVPAPYPLRIAWDQTQVIERFSCHERCVDAFTGVFRDTLAHYGMDKVQELRLDLFGGCLNVRRKRGGSSWSVHAFGAAIDLDPDRNRLHWRHDEAALAKPEYRPFWQIVESYGLVSLGRTRDFDWMHFQAAC